MIDLPERKSIRLKNYDYSQNGLYFLTVCTYDKANLFGQIVGAIHESPALTYQINLNENGIILKSFIKQLSLRYSELKVDKYIIMPNHVHLILEINNERAIHESPLQRRSLISKSIGYLKINVSKKINALNGKDIVIWQRSYHDHIIRNEKEYQKVWQYIDENPLKWNEDKYYRDTL